MYIHGNYIHIEILKQINNIKMIDSFVAIISFQFQTKVS